MAGQATTATAVNEPGDAAAPDMPDRVSQLDGDTIEIDFSDLTFRSSEDVNAFFDPLDRFIENRDRSWYFIVNIRNNKIWPEAWVSHAHRLKKIAVSYARAMVRYDESDTADHLDPEIAGSREAARAALRGSKSPD